RSLVLSTDWKSVLRLALTIRHTLSICIHFRSAYTFDLHTLSICIRLRSASVFTFFFTDILPVWPLRLAAMCGTQIRPRRSARRQRTHSTAV
ncbi:MAG: hypothetical protein KDB03_19620, partial [Planctomycetales bacterium]|nr:hypothetical protein [Planctomycetales bacterium]